MMLGDIQYFPEIQTALMIDSSKATAPQESYEPVAAGKYKIVPWGSDNLLPQKIMNLIGKNDIVSANLKFNRDVCFGLGPKLIRVLARDHGKISEYEEVTSGPEYDFFEANDISLFITQQLTDMIYFYNAFPLLKLDKSGNKISQVRHREAVFSRWGAMKKGEINDHYYCTDWSKADTSEIIHTRVLDEFNTLEDLTRLRKPLKEFIFPAYMPTPGQLFYSRPEWHSIFQSGWYDHSCMVPLLKKAILKNQLGVKFIIYVSPEYFENICKMEGIDMTDRKAYADRVEKEKNDFNDFLSGETNANKAIMSLKKLNPTVNGAVETKQIEIVKVENDLKGGEYIDDTESTANIICYAMGVHSSLIGATPGKNSNAIGGSQARELYLMKQALMKPVVNRTLRSLTIVKNYNKWDKDIMINIPEYIFTTLDQNKSGKEESTNTSV